VAGQSSDQIAAENIEFNRARREMGLPPIKPIAFLPGAYCAKTEKEAQKGFRHIEAVTALSNWHYGFSDTNPTDFAKIPGYEQYAAIAAGSGPSSTSDTLRNEAMIGTPEQIIERIQRYQKKTNCQQIIMGFNIVGSAPQDEIEQSMRLFAKEVLPAVHDINVDP
jgi:alkanesulfonate monooxygenase SsuD/methylene tetrahydromethanopterin reductase-like flavin-dependent oxidoreductase (luciferase family)